MPTIADIYSAIDSAKRKGSDFVRNPDSSLQQMVGLANDRAGQLNQQTAAAAQEGAVIGPQTQALGQTIAEGYNPVGMTVFHGSPHLFERFDMSKIGTGEGAQAYGKGMYMAQSPSVAEGYQKTLSNDLFNVDGKIFDPNTLQHLNVKTLTARGDLDNALQTAKRISMSDSPSANLAAQDLTILENIKNAGGLKKHEGNLYKVDLPDTHVRRMLDWDAPLKDQPAPVRKLAKSLGLDMNDLGGDLLAHVGKDEAGKQILEKAGIRGIKYLDQQSRNAGGWHITPPDQTVRGKWMVKSSDYNSQGMHFDTKAEADKALKSKLGEETRNFVVFDPNHLTVLERNQQPIK